jgi:hypothetical protein
MAAFMASVMVALRPAAGFAGSLVAHGEEAFLVQATRLRLSRDSFFRWRLTAAAPARLRTVVGFVMLALATSAGRRLSHRSA